MNQRGFYVGYLPAPPDVLRFVRIAVPVVLWLSVPVAIAIAATMRSPGDAVWSFYEGAEPMTQRGVLTVSPYPMLHWTDEQGHRVSALLVEEGKIGARESLVEFENQTVELRAHTLERDGRLMFELLPDAEVASIDEAMAAPSAKDTLGDAVLRGEIMDAKCFLGAMKPGEGLTHRQCARLCVDGGIPPVLVTTDATGTRSYFLLTEGGRSAKQASLPLMGKPVQIEGTLGKMGGWFTLDIASARGL